MPIYNIRQNFNNNSKTSSMTIDTDVATANILVAFMPDGVASFSPDANGATGTARPFPSEYVDALAICRDSSFPSAYPSYVGIQYGKPTLSDDDIELALNGTIKLTTGTACDSVQLKKYNLIGANNAPAT